MRFRSLPTLTSLLALPFLAQPVVLEEDMPYLLQLEGNEYLVTHGASIALFDMNEAYVIDDLSQEWYFTPVDGMPGTYQVRAYYADEWLDLCVEEGADPHVMLDHDHYLPTGRFTLVPDEDGWVRIQEVDTGEYICMGSAYQTYNYFDLGGGTTLRFRLICDDIAWSVTDRGTTFNQPIMPPAQLDFAYRGELQNCASGELTDSIGTTEERTWEVMARTTEGFEVFSSVEQSVGVEVGLSVSASIGAEVAGLVEASGEVEFSTTVSYENTSTTRQTASQEQTWSNTTSGSKTVSHTRDYVVPPHTAVLIRDAIKTVRDVRVPFTQVLRVTATTRDQSRVLTGEEIQSQMMFNFVGGLVTTVGADFVDVSLRGYTLIDQMFEATTYVDEIEGACD